MIIKKFDSFSPSIVYSNFKKRFNHDYAYHQLKQQKHKIEEDIFLIWDHWAKDNYFHWMIDSLSRLIIAIEFNSTPCVVLHESMPNFIFETLKAFPEIKSISIKKNTLITSENIYMPGYVISSGFMEKDFGKKVRNKLLNYLSKLNLTVDKGDKIYVSRSKQKIRKLINEEKLIEVLISEGYAVINFEDYSFWEQVNIMSNASILISPHGSNLVNMLFMKENSTIIEINKTDTQNATLCYWSMTEALEFDYYYIPAVTLDDNFVADDQLIESIKSIII